MAGSSEQAIPERSAGRSWPTGVAPTTDEAAAGAAGNVRDAFATADALSAAVSAVPPGPV